MAWGEPHQAGQAAKLERRIEFLEGRLREIHQLATEKLDAGQGARTALIEVERLSSIHPAEADPA